LLGGVNLGESERRIILGQNFGGSGVLGSKFLAVTAVIKKID